MLNFNKMWMEEWNCWALGFALSTTFQTLYLTPDQAAQGLFEFPVHLLHCAHTRPRVTQIWIMKKANSMKVADTFSAVGMVQASGKYGHKKSVGMESHTGPGISWPLSG